MTHAGRAAFGALIVAVAIAAGCGQGSTSSAPLRSIQPSHEGAIATPADPPTESPVASSAPTAALPTATPDPVGDIECDGSATTGTIDYVDGATGGATDLELATRALGGVLPSDEIVVDGDRSGVLRDGRTVFTGWWFTSDSGGWLLSTFSSCSDAGIRGPS